MASSKREGYLTERSKVENLDDPGVAAALSAFADALDPEDHFVEVPKPRQNGTIEHESKTHSTAESYLQYLRLAHDRGLDLLGADAETVNRFMKDLVADPDHRRYGLVEHDGSIKKSTASNWQAAFRAFYRFCTEPGADGRPDVAMPWESVDGSHDIIMFSERSDPKHGEEDMPGQDDLDALREACLNGQNTLRDRAFLELAAGTGQRNYALVTLKVGHVFPDGDSETDYPYILLNPDIKNDGDKGAIDNAGTRKRPIVSNVGPIREWIRNHPLRDPDLRAEHGAPEEFEDCYLFIGDVGRSNTDASTHWHENSPRDMLNRRKADTANMPNVKTVTIPVNPHNWRHYAYTKSKELPIDESVRRKMFGWVPGSNTGDEVYGHVEGDKAGEIFSDAWDEMFGDENVTASVAEQVVGEAVGGDLSPEARKALVRELASDPEAMDELAAAIADAAD